LQLYRTGVYQIITRYTISQNHGILHVIKHLIVTASDI